MAFVAATSSMFTPDELLDALNIPFAEVVSVATSIDVSDRIVLGVVNGDDVYIASRCPHCCGHPVEATVPGGELTGVLVHELGVDIDAARAIVRACYWLPTGTVLSVDRDQVMAAEARD